jgi:hypothetical protein
MKAAVRLIACVAMAVTSSAAFAGESAGAAAGTVDPPTRPLNEDAHARPGADAKKTGDAGATGGGSGEPVRERAGARSDARPEKGSSGWFPSVGIRDYADQSSRP